MTLYVMVDAEQLVAEYLREVTEVTALVGDRVSGEIPANAVYPRVLVQRVPGPGQIVRDRLDEAHIQIDAFDKLPGEGGTKAIAHDIAAAARAALMALQGIRPNGVVTGVREALGLQWLPEQTGRPRYVFESAVFVHPL